MASILDFFKAQIGTRTATAAAQQAQNGQAMLDDGLEEFMMLPDIVKKAMAQLRSS